MDEQIRFIRTTSGDYFNCAPSTDDNAIREFFENGEINLLAAIVRDEIISFQHRIPQTEERCLLFYKTPRLGIPSNTSLKDGDEAPPLIGFLTLEGGIVKSIYNSVSRIFAPNLYKNSDYTPEISKLVENLHLSLGAALGFPDSGIQIIQDEINFWLKKSTNSPTKSDKEQAKMFASALSNINQQLESLENSTNANTLTALEEFLDSTHNYLDEIWKISTYHYPQNRMADLMDVICSHIIGICVENMTNEDIWNSNSIHINTLIIQVGEIIDAWIQVCDTLTRLFWPNYNQHRWTGEPHVPLSAVNFQLRLNEIKNIKSLYKQVASLLSNDENYVKMLNKMFLPFKDSNIFDITPLGQQRWKKSVSQFESILEPIDNTVATILKAQLHNYLNNPRQVIHIFTKHDILTRRPVILESLTAEREQFLQTLLTLINDLQSAIAQNSESNDTENLSPIVYETRWLKIVEHQIQQIEKIQHICTDRNGYQNVVKLLNGLKEDVDSTAKTNFQRWCSDSLEGVKAGDLRLRDDKPVVQFERDGRQFMRVTFNPKIVIFCHDIREFENLGFKVPIELREAAVHALKFMSYARALQQISSFHNTIGDRMIPCQRPIMLKNAVELSNLVRSESVPWNDEESVSRYVKALQVAVNKMSRDNTLLASYHDQTRKIIVKLMNTDLLRQGQIWKDEMRRLREIIATMERQGYTNLDAFKLHWDHQLYKVLEHQYIAGLCDMNHKLPDIHIDLVFRQQSLQFKPPMEEIRSKYYSQLRKFIERPLEFRGLSDQSDSIFKIMVHRNRQYFTGLYQRGEDLMNKLHMVKEHWVSWVSLGCVEIEQLCNVHLSTSEDWDMNFKTCKHFSQQIAKIQNTEEQIDCFIINLSPLRADIEFISRRYWETLSNSLRQSILENITVLQEFLQNALQTLENVPIDETGIADAGAQYEKILVQKPKMAELLKTVQQKDSCLAGWCKERVTSLNVIQMQWEQLQPLIDNHHSILQRQIDIMKDHISSQCNNLKEEIEKFQIRWESTLNELEANENSDFTLFKERQNQWNLIKEKSDRLISDSVKFNSNVPDDVKQLIDDVEGDVQSKQEYWEVLQSFTQEYDAILAEEWTVYRRRPYILSDLLNKWQNNIKVEKSTVNMRILTQIQKYQNVISTLQILQSDALTEKHWARVFVVLGKPPKPYHEILLKDILQGVDDLAGFSTEIQNIVRQAASEQIVRQALTELEQWGVSAILKLTPHTDSKGQSVMLIKDFQDVLNKIGDNQCLLQSAKNSSAFEAFSDQAEVWESRLNNLDRILTSLNQIQRKWIYLEPIFGSGTLRSEEAVFMRIDKDFRFIMREISNDARVLSACKITNIINIIDALETQLSRCQNTLTSYITTKRNAFPRFYFLGNDDLLEILGQASKEPIIQKHINKLFPGIHHVGIQNRDNLLFISSIHSAEGDEIKLTNFIPINVAVEDWLNQLVIEIKFTLKDLIIKCCDNENNFNSIEVMKLYPAQVLCLANFIFFTRRTEKAISSLGLQALHKSIKENIDFYTNQISCTKDTLLQIKLRSILLDLVHQSSIIQFLIENNVTSQNEWNWLQQLKFYLNAKQQQQQHRRHQEQQQEQIVTIRMVYAEFEYSYEYLGNANKLVHTSLTHKCYLTLTQAMHLGLGGNPFGPAGTGKTECVKALGAMLGRLVLVFNCSENVDTAAMGLILSGLARCGAWGCFDEFNRLQETTLSAISMIIQPLQAALKDRQDVVSILDDSLPLNLHCGIFVTLNPAGEAYGGRQNLPSNLQALFRPIVMQQPEPKEIARVLLFVEGFKNADVIGARMVELFTLAGKMLSPQRHYDWGLRELKTVLTACGKALQDSTADLSSDDEIELAVRSLRVNTMSKLTMADCKRFDMLLADVFPNTQGRIHEETELRMAISGVFNTMGLQSNPNQIEKCMELFEQLQKRMGVVIIGPPSSGKTTLLNILKQALTSLSKTIRAYTIAPKSMTRTQLLGKLDPDTRQWNDGVLTTTAVAVNSELPEITSWIICDGDVDPEWIEALNSVLDDNRLLTLPSGWRIQFGTNINFIFETHDLSHASPATISRMGIINISADDLSESIIVESWLAKQANLDILRILMEQYFKPALQYVWSSQDRPIKSSKIALTQCGLQHLVNTDKKDEFCIGLLKGFGAQLNTEAKNNFAKELFLWADIYISDQTKSEYAFYNGFRDAVEIYDDDTDASINISENITEALIRTANVKANLDILRAFFKSEEKSHFLLYGPVGCGKTLLLENAVTEFSGYQFITIKCSAQLTASYVLYILKQNCLIVSGVRGREYKPRLSKLVLYFRNIDLCPIDCWSTSEVIELLLQIINRNGFYAENLEWISISGIQICGSFSDSVKTSMFPRFISIMKLLVVGYPNETEMKLIVSNQFSPVYEKFSKDRKLLNIQSIVEGLINVYSEIKTNFTPDISNHYVFTPKMVTSWIYGLMNYPENHLQQAIYLEARNIFRNRLISYENIETFENIIATNLENILGHDKNIQYFIPTRVKAKQMNITSEEDWRETVQRNISICATEDIMITSPVTDELLNTTAAICRSLSRPSTNLILCGRIGSKRREALHIASTILQVKIFTTQLVRNYSLDDFYNDLKTAMQSAALEDQTVVFVVDQTVISFLNDIMKPIEAVLEGSEIPNLFGEDLEAVSNPLRAAAQMDGFQDTLSSYFLNRVQNNLHLVITLENTSNELNELFGKYPALYRNVDMIWIQPRSINTMDQLPKLMIEQWSQINNPIPIFTQFSSAVLHAGYWANSPLRFDRLVRTYFELYTIFSNKIKNRYEKLEAGVDKLATAHSVVGNLKKDAIEQEVALAEKRKLAAQALDMISSTMRNATDQRTDMLELKKKTEESSEKLKERKKAIELELKEVEPILKEASAAVGQIKTEALSEIRSLRAPPDTIRDILEGVLRLMGIRDTSWNSMKTFLAKRGVKEDIRSLDPARVSPENCTAIEKLLETKSESFELKNAKRASAAAAPLATWVIAVLKYSRVVQSIKPLEREQNELLQNLSESENQMKSLASGLNDVDARVKELSTQLNGYTQEAAVIELKLHEARTTLNSAETLIEKLNSEFVSWSKQLEELNVEMKTLDIKSFFVALCINYFSHYELKNRLRYINNVADILSTDHFNLDEQIITDQDKLSWESMGLTADNQSMENAALITKYIEMPYQSTLIPLIVDPSASCFKWIQSYLQSLNKSIEVTSQSALRFTYQIELAVRFGKILIVQDAHSIVPPLLSVITSNVYCRFNKRMIQVGNKLIDLHDDFKMVLVTSVHRVELADDIAAYISVVPFTVTAAGLTDQLLSRTIHLKKPELEEKRIELLKNEGELWKQRLVLQDKLLHELSTAQGDILKNEKLLKTLNDVKESSTLIDKSLLESTEIRTRLMEDYSQFKELCSNTSRFYVGISKLYYISISSFTSIFLQVMAKDEDFNGDEIYRKLIKLTYINLSRSVEKSKHLALALCVCKNSYPDQIPDKEWESFVTNFITSDDTNSNHSSYPSWIKNRDLVPKVSALKILHPQFYDTLKLNEENVWKKYFDDKNNDSAAVVPHVPVTVTEFQKILVAQIMRPDKMVNVMMKSAAKLLGITSLSVPQPSIQQIYDESRCDEPILFITISGTDPSKELKEFAEQKIGLNKYIELSVGKGTEEKSTLTVRKARESGDWICLKNVHLIPSWLKDLEQELQSPTNTAAGTFRIFLTCESVKGFPDSFMSKTNKILYEAPAGVKHKIQRLLHQWQRFLSEKRDPKIIKLYNVLFILNSVLQERRSFIPQGWCKWYDFSDSDLRTAIDFLCSMEKSISNQMEWAVLRGLYLNIAFGGRVDNSQDLMILLSHLEDFFDGKMQNAKWTPLGFNIIVPQSSRMEDYLAMAAQISNTSQPEMFGLAKSTNLSKDLIFCRNLLKDLRASYFHIKDNENFEKRVKPILSLWKKLTMGSNLLTKTDTEEESDSSSPWNSFLLSEYRISKSLFTTIHSAFSSLHTSMKQLATMPADEKQLMFTLCENQVPLRWRKIWSGPKLATDYLKAITMRGNSSEHRINQERHLNFGLEINFATLFNVDGFLAALKLQNARELGKSACDLKLKVKFNDGNITNRSEKNVTVNVKPLIVDGAVFKAQSLTVFGNEELGANTIFNSPSFDITFDEIRSSKSKVDGDLYEIPLYANVSRETLIANLPVQLSAHTSKSAVVYSGAALIVPDFEMV